MDRHRPSDCRSDHRFASPLWDRLRLLCGNEPPTPRDVRRGLAWSTLGLMLLTLGQVTLGAQVRGRVDEALTQGTPRPNALATVGAFDLWHRDVAVIVLGLTLVVTFYRAETTRSELALVRAAKDDGRPGRPADPRGNQHGVRIADTRGQVAHLTASSLILGAETVLFLLPGGSRPVVSDWPPGSCH